MTTVRVALLAREAVALLATIVRTAARGNEDTVPYQETCDGTCAHRKGEAECLDVVAAVRGSSYVV